MIINYKLWHWCYPEETLFCNRKWSYESFLKMFGLWRACFWPGFPLAVACVSAYRWWSNTCAVRATWSAAGGAPGRLPFHSCVCRRNTVSGIGGRVVWMLTVGHLWTWHTSHSCPMKWILSLACFSKERRDSDAKAWSHLPGRPQLGGDEVRCEPSPGGLLSGLCSEVLWPSPHPSSLLRLSLGLMPFSLSAFEVLHNGPFSSTDVYNFGDVWHLREGDTWRVWRWQGRNEAVCLILASLPVSLEGLSRRAGWWGWSKNLISQCRAPCTGQFIPILVCSYLSREELLN